MPSCYCLLSVLYFEVRGLMPRENICLPAIMPTGLGALQGRKPKGYWDRLVNVQREIDTFCREHNLPEGIVPLLQDFRRANRFDLTHAVERWGGLKELADLLEYEASFLSPLFEASSLVQAPARSTAIFT